MSKKSTTFTEKDRKNYEEGADVVPAGSLLGQCLENQAEEDSKKMPEPDNVPFIDNCSDPCGKYAEYDLEATKAACESLAEYAAPRESDYGDGINTAVIPALQRRAKAHRRKRNRRAR